MRRCPMLVLAAWLGACSLVNDPTDHQRLPPDELCDVYGEVVCRVILECCLGIPYDSADGATRTACLDGARSDCEAPRGLGPLALEPVTGYDADVAGAVLREGQELAEGCESELNEWFDRGFFRAFRGTRSRGQACFDPVASNPSAQLLSCAGEELSCVSRDGAFRCGDLGGRGEACLSSLDCDRDHWCERPDPEALGTCRPLRVFGASCERDGECRSFTCDGGRCAMPDLLTSFCARLDSGD